MYVKATTLTAFLCLSVMTGGGVAYAAVSAGTDNSSPTSGTALPAALRPAFYQSLVRYADPAYAVGKDGCATPSKQHLGNPPRK